MFAALLPFVVVSVVQGFETYNNTRDLAISQLNASTKAVAERQRDPFVIAQHLLMSLADNPEVRQNGLGCTQALASGLRSYTPSVNFVRADATGAVRCSVLPFESGATLATEDWWRDGIKKPEMTITPPVMGPISKKPVLILMLPIRSADNRQDGSLSTAVGIDFLAAGLKKAVEGKSGILAVVSPSGVTIAEGSRALPFKPDMTVKPGTGQFVRAANGQQWLYTSARLYGPNLFVVYAEPRASTLDAALTQFRVNTLLPLLSIVLASLAIWFGTHRLVVRWLRELGSVADRLANGDLMGDRKKFEQAPEEIAELSGSMHSMAEVINRRNSDLTLALEAKTALTREVHHRVKNNLQIITSLLTLQAARVAEPGAKDVLARTRARISALALIHRLLYEDGNGSEEGNVAIDNLMGELCAQLRVGNRNVVGVELICRNAGQAVPVDYAVPLSLFVVEAVTNAYRHAFPSGQKGVVTMEFKPEGDRATLTISDNGEGYDVDEKATQMGTELMQAFATQVNGLLYVASTIGGGTRVTLSFPLDLSETHSHS